MDGIINIYKEKGYTSHDVVAKLRGILKQKKIGHTGTLDPDAVGVLPVCMGKATRLCDMLTYKDKEYEAVIKLGIVTDTLDSSGNIIKESSYTSDEDTLRKVILSYVGDIEQIPPMYSAIKIEGKKLYELARKGIEVERTARKVTIHSIDILDIDLDQQLVTIKTNVSKGTYIRSLCDDIGRSLGCGACMDRLKRTRSGVFDIKESITLDKVSELVTAGLINNSVINVADVFNMKCMMTMPEYDARVKNGNEVYDSMLCVYNKALSDKAFINTGVKDISVYLSDGTFAAVYSCTGYNLDNTDDKKYRVNKMFL